MLCTKETYANFSLRFHQQGIKHGLPLNGSIEVTTRCNFSCIHCYIRSNTRCDLHNTEKEISLDEYCNILDQIAAAGCLWLQITGGEPLLRSDFIELYRYTKQKGILPILFTNGSLITEDIALFLKQYPPFSVDVTLYGASEKTYEIVTGNGDNFRKAIDGIELLKKHGIHLHLKSALIRQNVEDLDRMRIIAKNYECSLSFDPAINQSLYSDLPLENIRLSPEKVVELDTSDTIRNNEWIRLYKDYSFPEIKRSSLFWCNAGRCNFHIDSSGKLSSCIICRTPSYDLRQGTFNDGWINLISKTQEQKRTKITECTTCEDQIFCHQCPGHAMLENHDREGKIDYFCKIARLRKKMIVNKQTQQEN